MNFSFLQNSDSESVKICEISNLIENVENQLFLFKLSNNCAEIVKRYKCSEHSTLTKFKNSVEKLPQYIVNHLNNC